MQKLKKTLQSLSIKIFNYAFSCSFLKVISTISQDTINKIVYTYIYTKLIFYFEISAKI